MAPRLANTRRREPRRRSLLFGLAGLLVLACEKEQKRAERTSRDLVVFAAASLRDGFHALSTDFKRKHPGVQVTFNLAGTQELRTQIEHGADADVFAAADQVHIQALAKAGLVREPAVFATNEPVVVLSKDAGEITFKDLPTLERIVVGVPEVPIGRYTLQILDRANSSLGRDFRARFESKVVSRELNVKQVLAKVGLGEAQAGIVYRTDAIAHGGVRVVTIPAEFNVIAEYPIALATHAENEGDARTWIGFVVSPEGETILRRFGFGPGQSR
jgi:molybdate transport system substrate-binding protein